MLRRFLVPLLLALALLPLPVAAQDDAGGPEPGAELEELDELYAWGAVSSIIEVDEEGDGEIVGFLFHTDEAETYEVVMDDLGRALAKEASDRTDVVVELEGALSVDGLMVTVLDFRIVYVDPNDEVLDEDEPEDAP